MYISDTEHHELTNLGFQHVLPHPILQPYIRWYWRIQANLANTNTENLYPEGGSGFVFNFGDPLLGSSRTIKTAVFQGIETTSQSLTFKGVLSSIGVRFQPGGYRAFMDIPPATIQSMTVPADAIHLDYANLFQRLGDLPNWHDQITHLNQFFLDRFLPLPYQRLTVAFQTKFQNQAFACGIGDLARELGISERQLQRIFKQHVGLRPKQLLQFIRINKMRHVLKWQPKQTLTRIGQDLGFYDSAHFIKSFKQIVGMTPSAYQMRALTRNTGSQNSSS